MEQKAEDLESNVVMGKILSSKCIEGVKLFLVLGSIVDQKTDVIVNSTNKNLDLPNGGRLSKVISSAAGPDLQQECRENYDSGIDEYSVAVTDGHDLKCEFIFHVVCPELTRFKDKCEHILVDLVKQCLLIAVRSGNESIAFPPVATKSSGLDPHIGTRAMLDGVQEFIKEKHEPTLHEIAFVHKNFTQEILKEYCDIFEGVQLLVQEDDSKGPDTTVVETKDTEDITESGETHPSEVTSM